MSGFTLDKVSHDAIVTKLPDLEAIQLKALQLAPDFISMKYTHESRVPVAAVCLQDAAATLFEARYALYEALAHKVWYLEKREPSNESEFLAVSFMRFYADDVALRLYPAGEHLANAIVCMLDLPEEKLKAYAENRTSRQSIVGNYMTKEERNHPLTASVLRLAQSRNWQSAINYRNRWVHEQPPTVKGLGIIYNRQVRWQLSEDGKLAKLGFGGGDTPEYSVEEILGFVQPALAQAVETLSDALQFYITLLGKCGITIKEQEGVQVKLGTL